MSLSKRRSCSVDPDCAANLDFEISRPKVVPRLIKTFGVVPSVSVCRDW
jgi:hypothetical protein